MKKIKMLNVLLILSALNLTVMIPGGFVESRDFSHIAAWVLGLFNIFLTTLGILSLFLTYFVARQQVWAVRLALGCGFGYFAVYVLDLAGIFPVSPTPMPAILLLLEILGTLLSIPLMYLAVQPLRQTEHQTLVMRRSLWWLIGLAMMVGLGIIIFATKAAMSGS